MSNFDNAVEYLLENEGGLQENKDGSDPGGISNFGISLRFLRHVSEENLKSCGIFLPVSSETIRHLSRDQAIRLYHSEFWLKDPWDLIKNQNICNYIFDFAINSGSSNSIKCAQRAVIDCLLNTEMNVDGILGPNTKHFINTLEPEVLMGALRAERSAFYRILVMHNTAYNVFIDGWMNRTYRKS